MPNLELTITKKHDNTNDLKDIPNPSNIPKVKKSKSSKSKKNKTKLVVDENPYKELYEKINYQNNPLDKDIQDRIHHLYNSLTPDLQEEWLEKTSGLGWSDEYIIIALSYWDKQTGYINRDEEAVKEFWETLTPIQKSNYEDVCNVFSPDKHYVHIKDSCGFLNYLDEKVKVEEYYNNLTNIGKNKFDNITKNMSYPEKFKYTTNLKKYKEYFENKKLIDNYLKQLPDNTLKESLMNDIKDFSQGDKIRLITKTPDYQVWVNNQ